MRTAVIICGPESSGNKFLTSLLVEAGCVGRATPDQPFDGPGYSLALPAALPEKMAYFRSLPHGGTWPDLASDIVRLREAGYATWLLVLVRDQEVVESSQMGKHVNFIEDCRRHIGRAYRRAFAAVLETGTDYLVVTYSSLARPSYRQWLCHRIGLFGSMKGKFVDGDAKHVGGG
jgi:hypothetical protein